MNKANVKQTYLILTYIALELSTAPLCVDTETNCDATESIGESLAQFENQIKPRVFVRRIMHSTLYVKVHFVSRNWRKEKVM